MSRDPKKLHAFHLADALVIAIYKVTQDFPTSERFGLQAQVRRAAVSTAANIVEGSARRTTREYLHFLNIALGSANEARYLLSLSGRLGFTRVDEVEGLSVRATALIASLAALVRALERAP
jgi:four helix bundle protein